MISNPEDKIYENHLINFILEYIENLINDYHNKNQLTAYNIFKVKEKIAKFAHKYNFKHIFIGTDHIKKTNTHLIGNIILEKSFNNTQTIIKHKHKHRGMVNYIRILY
jgi:hypothetical protein